MGKTLIEIMNKVKTKKIKFFALFGFSAAVLVTFIVIIVKNLYENATWAPLEEIRYMNEVVNCDIMVYGDEEHFYKELQTRRIDDISEESFSIGKDCGYRAIFIFDRSGKCKLTDEQLLFIKNACEVEGVDMYYIGKQYLETFQRLKFTTGYKRGGEMSLMYIGSNKVGKHVQQNNVGNMYAEHGLWREEDEKCKADAERVGVSIFSILYSNVEAAVKSNFAGEYND